MSRDDDSRPSDVWLTRRARAAIRGLALVLAIGCADNCNAADLETTHRTAVVAAYQPEWLALQRDLHGGEEHDINDMESAAAARVAYANDKPFIVFRSLSDLAGGGDGENEIGTFLQLASDTSAAVVRAFLTSLP